MTLNIRCLEPITTDDKKYLPVVELIFDCGIVWTWKYSKSYWGITEAWKVGRQIATSLRKEGYLLSDMLREANITSDQSVII